MDQQYIAELPEFLKVTPGGNQSRRALRVLTRQLRTNYAGMKYRPSREVVPDEQFKAIERV
jgi:hypothetical protein